MGKAFGNFITDENTALLLIDFQPQMLMGIRSDDPAAILDNAAIIVPTSGAPTGSKRPCLIASRRS